MANKRLRREERAIYFELKKLLSTADLRNENCRIGSTGSA